VHQRPTREVSLTPTYFLCHWAFFPPCRGFIPSNLSSNKAKEEPITAPTRSKEYHGKGRTVSAMDKLVQLFPNKSRRKMFPEASGNNLSTSINLQSSIARSLPSPAKVERICQRCEAINFKALFDTSKMTPPAHGLPVLAMFDVTDLENSICPVCSLFAAVSCCALHAIVPEP
jgi:hypothetical protein